MSTKDRRESVANDSAERYAIDGFSYGIIVISLLAVFAPTFSWSLTGKVFAGRLSATVSNGSKGNDLLMAADALLSAGSRFWYGSCGATSSAFGVANDSIFINSLYCGHLLSAVALAWFGCSVLIAAVAFFYLKAARPPASTEWFKTVGLPAAVFISGCFLAIISQPQADFDISDDLNQALYCQMAFSSDTFLMDIGACKLLRAIQHTLTIVAATVTGGTWLTIVLMVRRRIIDRNENSSDPQRRIQ